MNNLSYNDLAITSIGLDGEEIDQVTYMEKPRVYALEGYLVATAKEALSQFVAKYEILEETDVRTPIGNVVILRITKAGNALIAGPSIVFDMEKIIKILESYHPKNIFIDGAFFRHSFIKVSEATIFVVGANMNASMDTVINDAVATVKKFNLPIAPEEALKVKDYRNVCFINEQFELLDMGFDTVIGNVDKIFMEKNKNNLYLYLPKSLTNEFLEQLIENRKTYQFDIILDSPINIQLSNQNMENLFKLQNKLFVINQVNLVAVCLNPTSPKGYQFDKKRFKDQLERALKMDVFNVIEETEDE